MESVDKQLIFIASQPRSGSTLLQNYLSNNVHTNTCSEPWLLLTIAPLLSPDLVRTPFDQTLATKATEYYLDTHHLDNIKFHAKELADKLYEPMFNGFDHVIDKTPRYWEILEQIKELFPTSTIIVLKRNPRDVANSIIKTWKIPTLNHLNYFRRDLIEAPKAIEEFSKKYAEDANVITIHYETLCKQTEDTVKSLYRKVGIPYTGSVLDTSKNEKYKGKFGDPFQNKEIESRSSVKRAQLNQTFNNFVDGYMNFLGSDFLRDYGYVEDNDGTSSYEFDYFLTLSDPNMENSETSLKNEIKKRVLQKILRL